MAFMIITYSGEKGIKCQVSDFSLVVDPEKKTSANVVIKTKTKAPIEEGDYEEITGAGEYEISGTRITGIQIERESTPSLIKTAYVVKMDEIVFCFLNSLEKEADENLLEKIPEIDVLFLPKINKDLDVKKVSDLVKQIEPRAIVILDGDDAPAYSKELGQKPEKMEKLVTKKKELAEMNSKLIWIQA